jgi:hypothetical protein
MERSVKISSRLIYIGAAASSTVLISTAVWAQETPARPGIGFGAVAGYVDFSGDTFERIGSTFGFEAAGRYTWESNIQIVAGVHYSNHAVDDTDAKLGTLVFFADPRYVFPMIESQRFAPYFGARVAYVRLGFNDASANGVTFGGVAGFYFEFVPSLAFEFFGYFGGLLLDAGRDEGMPLVSDDTNGSMAMVMAGLVYTFP